MSTIENEIRALEAARVDALQRNDVQAVAALMDEDLIHIHATGRTENYEQFVAGLQSLPRSPTRESLHVRVYGNDVAVLTGEIINTVFRPGKPEPEIIRAMVTQVARRRPDGWKFVSFHASKKE
ncbi:MAG: SgcJ/EcaC family oxidoreductase [Burkholderiaceae bacterium]